VKQSRKQSLIEVGTSTTIGMVGSWLLTMGCLMVFTSPIAIATSTTILCTIWSLGRGYVIRRHFCNKEHVNN
jgi:hypothetical protein